MKRKLVILATLLSFSAFALSPVISYASAHPYDDGGGDGRNGGNANHGISCDTGNGGGEGDNGGTDNHGINSACGPRGFDADSH